MKVGLDQGDIALDGDLTPNRKGHSSTPPPTFRPTLLRHSRTISATAELSFIRLTFAAGSSQELLPRGVRHKFMPCILHHDSNVKPQQSWVGGGTRCQRTSLRICENFTGHSGRGLGIRPLDPPRAAAPLRLLLYAATQRNRFRAALIGSGKDNDAWDRFKNSVLKCFPLI